MARRKPDWAALGRLLTERRTALGLTRTDLSRRAEVSQTTYRELEDGKSTNPKTETLVRVARALSIDPAELLELAGRPKPRSKEPTPSSARMAFERFLEQDPDLDSRGRGALLYLYDFVTGAE